MLAADKTSPPVAEIPEGAVPRPAKLTDLLGISDLLLEHGKIRLRVSSWSMYPTLRPGDLIQALPTLASQIRLGEPVLFHSCGQLVCHRLVGRYQEGGRTRLVTKGDRMPRSDEPIDALQVLGRVVAIERNGRFFRPDEGGSLPAERFLGRFLLRMHSKMRGIRFRMGRLLRGAFG